MSANIKDNNRQTADSAARTEQRIVQLMQRGGVMRRLQGYLRQCHDESGEAFPNLAGFCRHLGVGIREFCAAGEQFPDVYDEVMTQLEDEALNARRLPANSSSLTAAYFKRRLGYDGEAGEGREAKELRVLFEHDVEEAGG